MSPTYLPYERMSDPAALWTAVPRGLRGFISNTEALDLKPVNDQQILNLTGTLPANFAYVFANIHLTISQNKAGNWTDTYTLNLQNWYQGILAQSETWNLPFSDGLIGGPSSGDPQEKNSASGSLDYLPAQPMWAPRGTSGILIVMNAENLVGAAATAGTVNAHINFWEFDLEQVRKYPINTPIPVHAR